MSLGLSQELGFEIHPLRTNLRRKPNGQQRHKEQQHGDTEIQRRASRLLFVHFQALYLWHQMQIMIAPNTIKT